MTMRLASDTQATGHRGTGGIQKHSCGPIFPYHVVIKGGNTVYAMHSDGTQLTHHRYGSEHQTFQEAHLKAENDAKQVLAEAA